MTEELREQRRGLLEALALAQVTADRWAAINLAGTLADLDRRLGYGVPTSEGDAA
jgi:hypothetical protein